MLTERLLFMVIPSLVLAVALLGVRRYAPINIARVAGGMTGVWLLLFVSAEPSMAIDPAVLILLAAIAATLVGQGYEAERQRARARRASVGLASSRML